MKEFGHTFLRSYFRYSPRAHLGASHENVYVGCDRKLQSTLQIRKVRPTKKRKNSRKNKRDTSGKKYNQIKVNSLHTSPAFSQVSFLALPEER